MLPPRTYTSNKIVTLVYNSGAGTDASPVWTGSALQFGGTSGANELRWATSGATTTTASANWPFVTRTASTFAIAQLWAFVSDAVGLQISTYDGTNAKANVVRWSWDTSGTFAAAPQFSSFTTTAHTEPTPPDGTITGGGSPDTGTAGAATSYLKLNAWGSLLATTGTNLTAGAVGTAPLVTVGNQAGLTTTTSANWLNAAGNWQSAQGFAKGGIIFGSVPAAVTANTWPWTLVLFCGPNLVTGTLTPVVTVQYSYS